MSRQVKKPIHQKWIQQLEKLGTGAEASKHSTIFGLMQQPGFRDWLEVADKKDIDYDTEPEYEPETKEEAIDNMKGAFIDAKEESYKDLIQDYDTARWRYPSSLSGPEMMTDAGGYTSFFTPQTSSVDLDVNQNLLDKVKEVATSMGEGGMVISSGRRTEEKTKELLNHFKRKFKLTHNNGEVVDLIDKILLRKDSKYYANTDWRNEFVKNAKSLGLKSKEINRIKKKIEDIRKTYGGMQSGHILGTKIDIPYSNFIEKYGMEEGMKKVKKFKSALRKSGIHITDEPDTGRYGVLDLTMK
jgi:hypothetical protein